MRESARAATSAMLWPASVNNASELVVKPAIISIITKAELRPIPIIKALLRLVSVGA